MKKWRKYLFSRSNIYLLFNISFKNQIIFLNIFFLFLIIILILDFLKHKNKFLINWAILIYLIFILAFNWVWGKVVPFITFFVIMSKNPILFAFFFNHYF